MPAARTILILTSTLCMALACAGQTQEQQYLSEQQAALSSVYAMQVIPSGTYTIGCTPGQASQCIDDEKPSHDVILTQPYLMGETEVTQELYASVTGSNPSHFTSCGSSCPVETVSWYDAVAFANALSTRHGLPACYRINGESVTMPNGLHCGGFRLPTEAEWEVAARGGQDLIYSGSNNIDAVAWYEDNSNGTPHPVGQKQPNGYGLYDMTGNVYEWVWDTYSEYSPEAKENPSISNTEFHVFRGGSWLSVVNGARVSLRRPNIPDDRSSGQGFRVVLAVSSPSPRP